MVRKRYIEEQIIQVLREGEVGATVMPVQVNPKYKGLFPEHYGPKHERNDTDSPPQMGPPRVSGRY